MFDFQDTAPENSIQPSQHLSRGPTVPFHCWLFFAQLAMFSEFLQIILIPECVRAMCFCSRLIRDIASDTCKFHNCNICETYPTSG